MPKNNISAKEEYNPRWFIWTIVFLVVTGVSLVSFMFVSGPESDYQDVVVHRAPKQAVQKP